MKLDKSHIGQKFRIKTWADDEYFLLLAISSKGTGIGEDEDGIIKFDSFGVDDWLPYQPQPKQELLMSPGVIQTSSGFWFSNFESYKPLRVVLKNLVYTNPDGTIELSSTKTLEADLWIKIDGEQS